MEIAGFVFGIYGLSYGLYVLIVSTYIMIDAKNSASTFAWIFFSALLPVVGFLSYLLVGKEWKKQTSQVLKSNRDYFNLIKKLCHISLDQENVEEYLINRNFKNHKRTFSLLKNNSGSVLTKKEKRNLICLLEILRMRRNLFILIIMFGEMIYGRRKLKIFLFRNRKRVLKWGYCMILWEVYLLIRVLWEIWEEIISRFIRMLLSEK